MKSKIDTTTKKTNPVLLNACSLMAEYSQATGASYGIFDHNIKPIPETQNKLASDRNCCVSCIMQKNSLDAKGQNINCPGNISANSCRETHFNAIKNAEHSGALCTYTCPIGLNFWTSPIYLNGQFTGAIQGGGFEQTKTNNARIKSLAELMSICAKSLSTGEESINDAIKNKCFQKSDLKAKIEEVKKTNNKNESLPDYPLEKERKLLDALRRGDAKTGKQILDEILASLICANSGMFKNIRNRAIELAVLFPRVSTNSPKNVNTIPKKANIHLKSIQQTQSIEELAKILYRIIDENAEQIRYFQGMQHASSLRSAKEYIVKNLARKINLEEIARASGFSAPYFSTIFKEEMGENFSSYLNRLRVEKASKLLKGTNYNLSKIASQCGFGDQSWFSKIFKYYTGISPGKYRSQKWKQMNL